MFTLPKWLSRFFSKPSWEEAILECNSPKDICRIVRNQVNYREEKTDKWFPAKITWSRGYGDCDDFAVLVKEMCKQKGFNSQIWLYYSTLDLRYGHAILIGTFNDQLWFASNGDYREAKSVDDISEEVSRILWTNKYSIWRVAITDEEINRRLNLK